MAKKKTAEQVFGIEPPKTEVHIQGNTDALNFYGLTKDGKPVEIKVAEDEKWPRYVLSERKKEVMDAFLSGKVFQL